VSQGAVGDGRLQTAAEQIRAATGKKIADGRLQTAAEQIRAATERLRKVGCRPPGGNGNVPFAPFGGEGTLFAAVCRLQSAVSFPRPAVDCLPRPTN